MGLKCLLESNYLDPTQTTRGTDRRASDPLKERQWRKFVPTPLCPLLPSTWLKDCLEHNHCCSGGCHAPLMFIPSFLRKGKNKPKSMSPEVTLCQGTPDIFVAILLLRKKETPFFFDSRVQLHVPHRAGQLWWLKCLFSVWQKCNSGLMLPVWQEAASPAKERNAIGLRRCWVFSCSGTAVWSLGRMLGCWCAQQQKKLCAFLGGTNWPRWEEIREINKFLKCGTSVFLKSFGWRAQTGWHLSDCSFPAGWLNKQFSVWEMPDGASYCRY